MIRQATKQDKDKLKALYRQCFEDDDVFSDTVFKSIWRPDECLILCEKDEIVSMVMLPRFSLADKRKCGYIYALCTKPQNRGKGHMSELIREAQALCAGRGDAFTFLVPADAGLLGLYKRFGYNKAFFLSSGVHKAADTKTSLKKANASDYEFISFLYRRFFSSGLYIERDFELFSVLDALYAPLQGGFYCSEQGYVFFDMDEDGQKVIREAVPYKCELGLLLDSAAKTAELDTIKYRLPALEGQPYGSARFAQGGEEKLFFNLLFD